MSHDYQQDTPHIHIDVAQPSRLNPDIAAISSTAPGDCDDDVNRWRPWRNDGREYSTYDVVPQHARLGHVHDGEDILPKRGVHRDIVDQSSLIPDSE
jgi:hypothetical protein